MLSSYTVWTMIELMDKERHTQPLDEVSFALVRISYKLLGGDRMSLTYGTDVKIHGSEIHMICHIKRNPHSHSSSIARSLKVSRGAVSQIISKLERKGLVRKEPQADNARCLDLILTEKGQRAYEGHQRLHAMFTSELEKVLSSYQGSEVELIRGFLSQIEGSVDKLIDEVYSEEFFDQRTD